MFSCYYEVRMSIALTSVYSMICLFVVVGYFSLYTCVDLVYRKFTKLDLILAHS